MEDIPMDIEIRRLTPALAETYARFFDTTPHATGKEEHVCYCVWWCGEEYRGRDLSSPAKRRECAVEYVKSGAIQGYLAFFGGEAVGWCNANAKKECLKCYCWQRFMGDVPAEEAAPAIRVKSVFCFAIAPEMQRRGIASRLLERVCRDAEEDGFDIVEAYPNRAFIGEAEDFMGPAALFLKHGFTVSHETEQKLVVRKRLK